VEQITRFRNFAHFKNVAASVLFGIPTQPGFCKFPEKLGEIRFKSKSMVPSKTKCKCETAIKNAPSMHILKESIRINFSNQQMQGAELAL
jgi:hypothetical protein